MSYYSPVDYGSTPSLNHSFTKWHQAYFHQLKMLPAKWYTDDGDIEQHPENNMHYSRADTATAYPDDVENKRQATAIPTAAYYLFTKWRQYQPCQFKALQPKWNTDDGET